MADNRKSKPSRAGALGRGSSKASVRPHAISSSATLRRKGDDGTHTDGTEIEEAEESCQFCHKPTASRLICRKCGKPVCDKCAKTDSGERYCPSCFEQMRSLTKLV